jgi:DNA-binding NarL/FixJ family response regulator
MIEEDGMTRIVIADSDSAGRKALTLLLTHKLGITDIYEAGDADTLIHTLVNCPPDIFLLDWRLYGATAPETCRLFLKAYPALKIVLLSVNAEDRRAVQESGASFIHKGADPDDTLTAFRQLLQDH